MKEKNTRLIAGCPIQVTGTSHSGQRGEVVVDLGNGYGVKLESGQECKFYHHQLVPYPDLQTYEPYEH